MTACLACASAMIPKHVEAVTVVVNHATGSRLPVCAEHGRAAERILDDVIVDGKIADGHIEPLLTEEMD